MTVILQAKSRIQNPLGLERLTSVGRKPQFEIDASMFQVGALDSVIANGIGSLAERTFNAVLAEGGVKPTVVYDDQLGFNVINLDGSQGIRTTTFSNANVNDEDVTIAILAKVGVFQTGRLITAGGSLTNRKAIGTNAIRFAALSGDLNGSVLTLLPETTNATDKWEVLVAKFTNNGLIYTVDGKTFLTQSLVKLQDASIDTYMIGGSGANSTFFNGKLAYASCTLGNLTNDDMSKLFIEIKNMFLIS